MKKAASAAWAESGTACRDGGMIRFAALPVTDYNTAAYSAAQTEMERIDFMEKSFSDSYKAAGVDVNAGYKAVELMKAVGPHADRRQPFRHRRLWRAV